MTTFYNPDLVDVPPGNVVKTAKNRHKSILLYPPQGFTFQNPGEAIVVNANEVIDVQVNLGASAKTISQPQPVKKFGDPFLVPNTSIYIVTNNKGEPVDPKQWRQNGGRITVKINPDTVTATVTVRGMSDPAFAPFSIAEQDDQTAFDSLRLVGTGVAIWKQQLTIDTGLTDDDVADSSSAELDNPFMQSREQAYDAAHAALVRRLGFYQRATLNLTGVAGIDGIDPQVPESALGRLAGARVIFDGAFYRIRSASITPSGISATTEQDTTFGDFDDAMPAGMTFDQFNALHAGQSFMEFDVDPLSGGNLGG